jgi:tetratricopeptide (TPR) repeat protein
VLCDTRGEAWLCLGNALRVNNRLRRAERALRAARRLLDEGSGDAYLAAKSSFFLGGLRTTQRRYREAVERFHEAQRTFENLGDEHAAAEVMIALGRTHWAIGDVDQGARCLVRALPHIDPRRDKHLSLGAVQALAHTLNDAGFTEDAAAALGMLYALNDLAPGDVVLLRCQWFQAKLWAKLGHRAAAIRLLDTIRNAFLDLDLPFDAAQAALDLAALLAETGERERVAGLAAEMFPVFASLEIHRETRLALMLFVRAAQAHQVSAPEIARLSRDLDEARELPD